jgi:hypothetical protein
MIKDFKIFENSIYDELSSRISKKMDQFEMEINDIRSEYHSEVKECIWDLIDDGDFYILEKETTFRLSKYINSGFYILLHYNNLEKLLTILKDCNKTCKSHLGKEIEMIEILYQRSDNLPTTYKKAMENIKAIGYNYSIKKPLPDHFDKKCDWILQCIIDQHVTSGMTTDVKILFEIRI